MKTYKAKGIVLGTIKYGESSLIAHVLTDTGGRRSYLIQGVGKTRTSHGGRGALFQPMFIIEFEGLESSRTEMHRMKEVRLAVPLQSLPFDIRKSTVALFMAELLSRMVKEVQPDTPLFDFIYDSVVALDGMQEGVANFHLWFLVSLSRYLGFYPQNDYREGDFFDIEEGSFVGVAPRHPNYMSRENSQLLHVLMNCSADFLTSLTLSRHRRNDFLTSLLNYFGYHLDTLNRVQSLRILSEVF
ncbi:MAG: DNA repair protein RecO [Tidjanibacter sp.]|nr:DNA repair protein RecO [Tidjanibacter sp.]